MVFDWIFSLILVTIIGVIIASAFYKRLGKRKFIFIALAALMIVGILLIIKYSARKPEHFIDIPGGGSVTILTPAETINSMLREYGFESTQVLKEFLTGIYKENTSDIIEDNTLTVYYSVYSSESAPREESRVWRNTAPFFKTPSKFMKCSSRPASFEHTHLEFDETPFVNRAVGLELLSNNVTGPYSHQLGIQGNGTFSIFTLVKFNGFSSNNSKPYELFKLYGNTISNNALSLVIGPQPIAQTMNSPNGLMASSLYNANIQVIFGTQTIDSMTTNGSKNIVIDTNHLYLIILTKNNKNLTLTMHNMSKKNETPAKIIDNVELTEASVSLSNKEFAINANRNLNANIFAFGIYNIFLADEGNLREHFFKELYKSSDEFNIMARNVLGMHIQIEQMKACPYPKEICDKCPIDDWTDFQKMLTTVPECRTAIDEYCAKNTSDPRCRCWDPTVTLPECKAYVNIFRPNTTLTLENIDVDSLAKIKAKYNLCDCKDIDRINESIMAQQQNREANIKTCPLTSPDRVGNPDDTIYYGDSLLGKYEPDASGVLQEMVEKPSTKWYNFWSWLF